MLLHKTDRDWQQFSRTDPYWAVLTDPRFRREHLTEELRQEFFHTGEHCIDQVLETIRNHFDPHFQPRTVLDFGCGVGRLTLALAQRCPFVVGVDVAEAMLQEARANCAARNRTNVEFVLGDDRLSRVKGRFDLIVSHIVLQHIPCERGLALFRRLLELLHPDGVGAIHFTYARREEPEGVWAKRYAGFLRTLRTVWRTLTFRGQGPRMQMNQYDLNRICTMVQRANCPSTFLQFTDHGGEYGAFLFFRKEGDSCL